MICLLHQDSAGGLSWLNHRKYPSQNILLQYYSLAKSLCDQILEQNPYETYEAQLAAQAEVQKTKQRQQATEAASLKAQFNFSTQWHTVLTQQKGASSWLIQPFQTHNKLTVKDESRKPTELLN